MSGHAACELWLRRWKRKSQRETVAISLLALLRYSASWVWRAPPW
jgi:hypothetical protein